MKSAAAGTAFKTLTVILLTFAGLEFHQQLGLPDLTRILAVLPAAVLHACWKKPDPQALLTPYPKFFLLCLLLTPLFPGFRATDSSLPLLAESALFLTLVLVAFFFPYHWLDRSCARRRQTRRLVPVAWTSPFLPIKDGPHVYRGRKDRAHLA